MPKAEYLGFFLFLGWVLCAKHCLKSAAIYLCTSLQLRGMEGCCHSLSWKCKCIALALMADCCLSVSPGSVWKCKLRPLPVIYETSEEPAMGRMLPGKILNSMKCSAKTTCSPGTMWHDFCSSFLSKYCNFLKVMNSLRSHMNHTSPRAS